jgi:Chitin binding Peritrophin-A domain
MQKYILGIFIILAIIATVKCGRKCNYFGEDFTIPQESKCAAHFETHLQEFRWPFPQFPSFPSMDRSINRILRILRRIRNRTTRRPRPTPPSDNDEEDWPWECPEVGVKEIPKKDSCEKFILCINGMEIVRQCAEGFHFSRELLTCVPEDEADCEVGDRVWECPEDSDSISFIPNTEDCNKYYICFGGGQIPMACPEGLHWSVDEETCQDPDDAECKFGDDDGREFCPEEGFKQISHPKNCEKFIVCLNGVKVTTFSCPPGLHFSRANRVCMDPEKAECEIEGLSCPAEDDMDNLVFIPHPEDCSLYYLCLGGNKLPLSCGNGFHWSVEAQACMAKEDAGCEDFDDTEECPETGIKEISHPEDCELFILCINGQEFERSCPPGLHFSRETRSCVSPDVAECEINLFVCPEKDGDELVFLPDLEDCSRYFICIGGNKVPLSCGAGLHWSVSENTCLPEDLAECEFERDQEQCPEEGILSIPNTRNCEKYFMCVNGVEFPRTCSNGFHFSRDFRICVPPELASCTYSSGEDDYDCPEDGMTFVPSRGNCEAFYLCFEGNRFPFSCSNGNHWSRELQRCMHPDNAQCK